MIADFVISESVQSMQSLALSKFSMLNTVSEAIYLIKSLRPHQLFLSYKNWKLTFAAQVKEISFKAAFCGETSAWAGVELGLSWGFAPFVKTKEQAFLSVSKWMKKSIFVSLTQEAQITDLRFHPSRWNQLKNPLQGRWSTERFGLVSVCRLSAAIGGPAGTTGPLPPLVRLRQTGNAAVGDSHT